MKLFAAIVAGKEKHSGIQCFPGFGKSTILAVVAMYLAVKYPDAKIVVVDLNEALLQAHITQYLKRPPKLGDDRFKREVPGVSYVTHKEFFHNHARLGHHPDSRKLYLLIDEAYEFWKVLTFTLKHLANNKICVSNPIRTLKSARTFHLAGCLGGPYAQQQIGEALGGLKELADCPMAEQGFEQCSRFNANAMNKKQLLTNLTKKVLEEARSNPVIYLLGSEEEVKSQASMLRALRNKEGDGDGAEDYVLAYQPGKGCYEDANEQLRIAAETETPKDRQYIVLATMANCIGVDFLF